MELREHEAVQRKRVQLLFLIAAGVVIFPLLVADSLFPGYGSFLEERFMAVPCLLFFGSALCQRISPLAKKSLLLSIAMVLWFVVTQTHHWLTDMGIRNFGIFAVVYLLAFPYAAVTEDGRRCAGLNWIGSFYIAYTMLMVLLAGMLLLDAVPEVLSSSVKWDGTRLSIFSHPNGNGGSLMLGVGFSLYYFTQTREKWERCVWGILTALQFSVQALTSSRAVILLTCALIGGTLFFAIWNGSWKRFLAGAAVALAMVVVLFSLSRTLYDLHTQTQINKLLQQAQENEEKNGDESNGETDKEVVWLSKLNVPGSLVTTRDERQLWKNLQLALRTASMEGNVSKQELQVDEETGEITIAGSNSSSQGELTDDMKTLNGRLWIWEAAFESLRDNPPIRLWGTEFVSAEISYRMGYHVVNAHNSWIQTMMQLGIPGFLLAMAYTVTAIWNIWILLWRKNEDLGKKIVAMTMVCILAISMLESYLFAGGINNVSFLFFLGTGYLLTWNAEISAKQS